MAYKVLNSVSLKDTSSMRIANLNTSMLVIPVNTNTKKNRVFKEIDGVSNGYISKIIANQLKDKTNTVLLPQIQGVKAKNILLIKSLSKEDQIYKWLKHFQSITRTANQYKCNDI